MTLPCRRIPTPLRSTCLPLLFLVMGAPLAGQVVEDPVIPRGRLLIQVSPSSTSLNGILDPDHPEGRRPLGSVLTFPEVGAAQIPALAEVEDRLRELLGPGADSRLRLGAARGQISANEQVLPFRIGYGVLDRLTLGVTLPLVRRRVDSAIRLGPEGSNVGATPTGAAVVQFLNEALAALNAASAEVDRVCSESGEGSGACQEGRAVVADAGSFLDALSAAYDEEVLFPLMDTPLGNALAQRWSSLRGGLAEYGGNGPEGVILAEAPLSHTQFRELVLLPRWGEGFPDEQMESFLELGDIELHAALSLLRRDRGPEGGVGVRSALVGTVRFPTGTPDSLQLIAPLSPPRGVGGVELRWVTDLVLHDRLGLLTVAEAGRYGTREVTLVGVDPARLLGGSPTRAAYDWTPGALLRLEATPRLLMGPALSVGSGVQYVRRGAGEYRGVDTGNGVDLQGDPSSLLRWSVEMRYAALHPPVTDRTPFPFELLVRYSQPMAGEGPDLRRLEAGVRVLRSLPSLR